MPSWSPHFDPRCLYCCAISQKDGTMSSPAACISCLFFERVLVSLQDPFLDKLFWLWPLLDLLLQTICSHVSVEAALAGLQGGCSGGIGENVPYACRICQQSALCLTPVVVSLLSTSSSRSGRFSRCFLRLSECCWRSSSCCLACRALRGD